MSGRDFSRPINWAEDLPEFCSWSLLLVAVVLAQIGSILLLLGRPGLWSWQALGVLSWFSLWGALLIQAFWCITGRLLVIAVNRIPNNQRPGKIGWSLCWLLLWLEAVVLCMAMAQFLMMIDHGAGFNLVSSGMDPARLVITAGVIGALLSGVLLRYTAIWQRWQLQTRQQARMELDNLHARLRPHFLYNTLNSIAALISQRPNAAIDAIEDLSDLLRQSLQPQGPLVSLTREIELCQQYLQLMGWRLGDRLQTHWELAEDLEAHDWKIPPLTLQALVENAILHGIQPLPDGGQLDIDIRSADNRLQIQIRNPLADASDVLDSGANGTGTALRDLQRRLHLVYQQRAKLDSISDQSYYTVILVLPRA